MPIPSDYSTPARLSAKERALSQLQRWIIDGTLHPGEKLSDAELAEALGVSRTPVREALQLLDMQGLIETNPGKDTRVTRIEKDDMLKLYPALASLHALAAELAAPRIAAEQIEQLKEFNAAFAEAIERGEPYRAMEQDEQFHNLIVEVADNPYVASFSATLQMHIRRFKYAFLSRQMTTSSASVQEHAIVIASLEDRDADRAAAAMKTNLLRPMRELYAMIPS